MSINLTCTTICVVVLTLDRCLSCSANKFNMGQLWFCFGLQDEKTTFVDLLLLNALPKFEQILWNGYQVMINLLWAHKRLLFPSSATREIFGLYLWLCSNIAIENFPLKILSSIQLSRRPYFIQCLRR